MLYRFKLTYSGTDTTVIEPKGWSDFKSEIKRDFKSHGVIFKYSPGTLKLGFADGRDVLETAFQNNGYDAVVTFTVDQRASTLDAWANTYIGNAVMKNRDLNRDYFECDFESSTFQQKIINRLDIPLDVDRTKDLDGNTLTGSISKQTDDFNTIRLNRIYEAMTVSHGSAYLSYYAGTNTTATSSTNTKKLKGTFGFGFNKTNSLDGFKLNKSEAKVTEGDYNSATTPEPLWIATTGGTTTIEGLVNYNLNLILATDTSATLTATYALKLVQYRGTVLTSSTTIKTENYQEVGVTGFSHNFTGSLGSNVGYETFSETITHNTGDYFYLIFELESTITAGSNSMAGTVFIYGNDYAVIGEDDPDAQSYIKITHLPDSLIRSVSHWLVHDIFERLSYILTGSNSLFYSEFFGLTDHGYAADGCGGLNTITNGYQLRGIDETLNTSMREMLDWAHARYGIGWGFEKAWIEEDVIEFLGGSFAVAIMGSTSSFAVGDVVRITSPAHYLGIVGNITGITPTEIHTDITYVADDAAGTIAKMRYRIRVELMEHFYADSEILDLGSPLDIKEGESYKESSYSELEINSVKIGYKQFSDQIGVNDTIEDFLTESHYSLPVSTIKGDYNQTSPFIASNALIQATYDQATITTSWKYDESNFIIALSRSYHNLDGNIFIQENDENFINVVGLTDETTAYNIRHAPVYMMLDHALIINSALMGKPLDDLIQNASTKINRGFGSQLSGVDPCLLGDQPNAVRTAVGNIAISKNFSGYRLFDPIQHVFTVAMSSTQLNLIIDAMENNGSNNLGYLTYRDNEGNVQTGFPLVITWNPNDEIAEITTLEKADNYGI